MSSDVAMATAHMIAVEPSDDFPVTALPAGRVTRIAGCLGARRGLPLVAMAAALLAAGLWAGAATQRSVERCQRWRSQRGTLAYLESVQAFATTVWTARLAWHGRVAPMLAAEASWQSALTEMDQCLAALGALDCELGTQLNTQNRIDHLRSLWTAVKATAEDASPAALEIQFDRLQRATRELAEQIAAAQQPLASEDAGVLVGLMTRTLPALEDHLYEQLVQSARLSGAAQPGAAQPSDTQSAERSAPLANLARWTADTRRAMTVAEGLAARQTCPPWRASTDAALHRFLMACSRLQAAVDSQLEPMVQLGEGRAELQSALFQVLFAAQSLRSEAALRLMRSPRRDPPEVDSAPSLAGPHGAPSDADSRFRARDAGYVTAGRLAPLVKHE